MMIEGEVIKALCNVHGKYNNSQSNITFPPPTHTHTVRFTT